MNSCDRCRYVYDEVPTDEIPGRLTAFGPQYRAVIEPIADTALRRAPDVSTWSPLEYLCHVRDVFVVQRERLVLACAVDRPEFVPMGREERAVADGYNEQDPAVVLDELDAAARRLAATFAGLTEDEWTRVGIYNWPETAERNMAWLGRHTVHEGIHHLHDIEGLAAPEPD